MLVVSCVRLFLTLWTVACQTLFSMDYFQAKILEWIAISFSRDLPNPGIKSLYVFCIGRRVLYH